MREPKAKTPTPTISFQELATDYLTACRLRLQHNTFRQKIFVYRTFISFLSTDVCADSVTKKDIEAFLHECLENGIEGRPVGTKTVNRYLRDLKALYNWAIGQDIGIYRNPCRGIEKFTETPFYAVHSAG